MVVTSDSMLPALEPYDLIAVERTSIEQVKLGDIITFDTGLTGLGIVAHRAVEVVNDNGKIAISTKGDNAENKDPWIVHDEDLIGKVIDVVPAIGVLLVDPVRYTIVGLIIIIAVSIVWDVTKKPTIVDQV